MTRNFHVTIKNLINNTKVHKDAFVIPELMRMLKTSLEMDEGDSTNPEETILVFVEQASEALAASPIHSGTLMREFYRSILDLADGMGIPRVNLLEDLLFQSLRRPAEPEKSKRRKQKDARSRILLAALDEFSEKGYHPSTIDGIAERAGIAKGTVYRYFNTKEGLFNALKEDTMSEFVELARRDLSRKQEILQIIEGVITMYLSFFEKNSSFFKVIIQEHKDFGREFSEKFINELILALPGLKRRCWKASRSGKLKQMNYFTVFFGIIGFLNGVIQKWLHEGAEGQLLDEIDTIREVLFYGFVVQSETKDKPRTLEVIS